VARVVLAEGARADLDRPFEFLAAEDVRVAGEAIEVILDALNVLERHPLIGRLIEEDFGELVISCGKTGYVALYDFYEVDDTILVFALRHQREVGFSGSDPGG
jgi:plasmid stabilization system protein ParE